MLKLIFALALVSSGCAAFDYCTINATNTLCLYKPNVFGSACIKPTIATVSATDKAKILALHNDIRRRAAKGLETLGSPGPLPSAANMRELTWDDELATMAQTWANQCQFKHDANRDVERFPVGQNIFTSFAQVPITVANWDAAIKTSSRSWYSEVNAMTADYVNSFPEKPPKVIGHYTALVWADTYKVGCGFISYSSTANPMFPYQTLYVCNYGPTSNYVDSAVYKAGAPASECPDGTIANDGLCA